MALIKCSDCGKEISDSAPTCPNCGKPRIATALVTPITIEQTSKQWKKIHLISWALIIFGLIVLSKNYSALGVILVIIGIIVRYVGKIGAWWTNK